MVQVAVPSRERVGALPVLRDRIEREVGRINGEFGRVGEPAVHYLNQPFDRAELAALYRAADVMVVTPLRDGMNLVAKEFVAARADDTGALVLSEFAGAAAELAEAYLVNPHDVDGLKEHAAAGAGGRPGRPGHPDAGDARPPHRHDIQAWARAYLSALDDTGSLVTRLSSAG